MGEAEREKQEGVCFNPGWGHLVLHWVGKDLRGGAARLCLWLMSSPAVVYSLHVHI